MNASEPDTTASAINPIRRQSRNRWLFRLAYPAYLLLLGWLGLQLYWFIQGHVLGQSKTDVWGYFYRKLPAVRDIVIRNDDETIDVLLLGASVLEQVAPFLEAELQQRATRPVRIHSLCTSAHTSRDSYLKYTQLSDKQFDLIIIYHGVNDVRMNCVQDKLFRDDYKHCYFYELLDRKVEVGSLNINVMLQSSMQEMITLGGEPEETLRDYGKNIKTREPFRKNLQKIIHDAHAKSTKIILMTFAHYLPAEYSRKSFCRMSSIMAQAIMPCQLRFGANRNTLQLHLMCITQ